MNLVTLSIFVPRGPPSGPSTPLRSARDDSPAFADRNTSSGATRHLPIAVAPMRYAQARPARANPPDSSAALPPLPLRGAAAVRTFKGKAFHWTVFRALRPPSRGRLLGSTEQLHYTKLFPLWLVSIDFSVRSRLTSYYDWIVKCWSPIKTTMQGGNL